MSSAPLPHGREKQLQQYRPVVYHMWLWKTSVYVASMPLRQTVQLQLYQCDAMLALLLLQLRPPLRGADHGNLCLARHSSPVRVPLTAILARNARPAGLMQPLVVRQLQLVVFIL